MIKKTSQPPIVVLCGSTRFKEAFIEATESFTLKGYIVLSVGLFGHADNKYSTVITQEVKEKLDELHKRKIDLADEVFVINCGGYIGDSTMSEINYAKQHNKPITYLEPLD